MFQSDINLTVMAEALSRSADYRSSLGLQLQILTAGTSDEIDAAFEKIAQTRPHALLIVTSTLFLDRRVRLATLAASHRLPTIFGMREFVEDGGLMSYGPSVVELYRQLGIYAGRILKGDKPSDLPVWRPTKFRTGHKPQNRQGARPHRPGNIVGYRR